MAPASFPNTRESDGGMENKKKEKIIILHHQGINEYSHLMNKFTILKSF
jgi:hypothetical protein